MANDTFYFSHDYNPRADEKIKRLIRKHGLLGYGTFWAIIEDLYNNANALRTDYEGIAYDLRVHTNIVKSVINDFDLFIIKDDFFGSLSVQRRLDERNEKSKKASNSANCRWSKQKKDANAMRTQCDSNAIKERKGKEIKEIKESKQITYNKVVDEILISLKDLFDEKYLKNDKTKVMFDKLLKKYSKDEILKATFWARNDDFWKTNFCSPMKLEKKNKEDVTYIDVFLAKAGNYKIPTTEPTKPALPYEGFNPLSIDLSKLKPLR